MSKRIECEMFEEDYLLIKKCQYIELHFIQKTSFLNKAMALSKPKAEKLVEYLQELIKELE